MLQPFHIVTKLTSYEGQNFNFPRGYITHNGSEAHPASFPINSPSSEINRPQHGPDHSPTFIGHIRTAEGGFNSIPPISFHCLVFRLRNTFAFTIFITSDKQLAKNKCTDVCVRCIFRFQRVADRMRYAKAGPPGRQSAVVCGLTQCQIASNPAIVHYSYVAECWSFTLSNPSLIH